MSLLTYADARRWANDIREKVVERTMPPWFADPRYGSFANENRLTDAEIATIRAWVAGGAREGPRVDLPPVPRFAEGWSIGEPDAVISMPAPFIVPAEGLVEYQYFEVPAFSEDKWVRAIEVRPGDRAVVHHALLFAKAPGMVPPDVLEYPARPAQPPMPMPGHPARDPGVLIATYAPGTNPLTFVDGTALLLKAGARITFEIHYATNGEPATDQTSAGFIFAPEPPREEMHNGFFDNEQFVIPAGASAYPVDASVGFRTDVKLWALFPHTHLRGSRWEYWLRYPDGRSETLLSIPRYDFNWQLYYVFKEPLRIPKGSWLHSRAYYDNSALNPVNPDPTVDVPAGAQTFDEMQYTGITYSIDSERTVTAARRR